MLGIQVEGLGKRFADFQAVEDVSFKVREGELVALLGPSGSGKSTILRMIAGLEVPDSGHIYLHGLEATCQRIQHRKVGFVFQHYALFKHMTVEKNIAFGLEVQKKKPEAIREKVQELIQLVKLEGYQHHFPSQLSGGQRQRVALARALAPEPRILLLDEPFGSLDTKVRRNLAHWLRDLHDRMKITSLFVTHDQNEAIEISDKIIVINRGRVEQIGSAADVYEEPESKFVASFVGNVNVVNAFIEKARIQIKGMAEPLPDQAPEHIDGRDIVLLVRPEDVLLKRRGGRKAGVEGRLTAIRYRGAYFEMEITLGDNQLIALVPKEWQEKEGWTEGEAVRVAFKNQRIFSAPEGHKRVHEMLKHLGYIE